MRIATGTVDLPLFKSKALHWASGFGVCAYLDSNGFSDPYSKFETLLAIGIKHSVRCNEGSAFEELDTFRKKHPGFVLGFFSYDLKMRLKNSPLKMRTISIFLNCIFLYPSMSYYLKAPKSRLFRMMRERYSTR